jgi:hypothetical protein
MHAHDGREKKPVSPHRWMPPWGFAGWKLERYSVTWSHAIGTGHALGEALETPPALAGLGAACSRAEILAAHVGAGEADRNPLPPSDLELDRGPMARRTPAIDAAAPDPFARLKIGVLVKAFDETAGVGRDCRFPFGAAPEQSKEHSQPPPNW